MLFAQVGEGAGNPQTDGGSAAENAPIRQRLPHQCENSNTEMVKNSERLRQQIQEALVGIYPGVAISVEKDANGPPAGYPINIEN